MAEGFHIVMMVYGVGCAGALGAFAGKRLNEYLNGTESDPMLFELLGAGAGLAVLIGLITYVRAR